MSKNKCKSIFLLFCVLLALPHPSFATSDSLISQDKIKTESANYDTYTVQPSVYEKKNTSSVSEFYPYTYSLRFEQKGATFVEYTVRRGDEVKKGDVLAIFELEADTVAMASNQLALKRMEDNYFDGCLQRHNAIQEMKEQLLKTSDPYDQAIQILKIQRAEVALEQYIYQQELNIANLKEEIAQAEEYLKNNTLISPFDGVIENVVYKRAGDPISTTEVLITLYREDYLLLRVDNKSMNFRFGMDVQVEVGRNKTKRLLTGRVVGADNLLPQSRQKGYAYIQLAPYNTKEIRLTAPKAIVSTYYLENVMVLPRNAVSIESGKYYVYQLIDGVPRKRYVNLVTQSTAGAWIIQGLDAGDVIVID